MFDTFNFSSRDEKLNVSDFGSTFDKSIFYILLVHYVERMTKEYSKKAIKSKIKIARDIVQTLTEVANKDDEITDDEISLIMNIKRNLNSYFAIIEEYDDSDNLTRSEEMHIIEKKLIQDATAKAFEDGKISDDEKQLLRKLAELMESIAKSK